MVVGLIPRAIGPMDADMRRALVERIGLIEARASAVLDDGLLAGEMWTRSLGSEPRGVGGRDLATTCVHGGGLPRPLRHRRREAARSGTPVDGPAA